jgi:hypothetical protein
MAGSSEGGAGKAKRAKRGAGPKEVFFDTKKKSPQKNIRVKLGLKTALPLSW